MMYGPAPTHKGAHLMKCYANPLMDTAITSTMWERSEAAAAAFMSSHTSLLSHLLHNATAANVDLSSHIPRRGYQSDGTSLQNRSVESMQPTFAQRWDLFGFRGECSVKALPGERGWDGSKFVCGLDTLAALGHNCAVYSVGSNNDYAFELAIAKATHCHIHTFDCNVIPRVPQALRKRVTFHRWCLGEHDYELSNRGIEVNSHNGGGHGGTAVFRTWETTLRTLGHKRVDLLKMDIEGYEWDVLNAMMQSSYPLPFQITIELHLNALWNSANLWWAGRKMTAGEVALWARRFYDLGYRVVHRSDNPRWPQCAEFALVRFLC